VVKIDVFAVFLMLYIFVSFGNNVDIVVHYDNNPFRSIPTQLAF